MESWICCQIGGRERYSVPRGLHRYGALEMLLTEIWVRPSDPLSRIMPSLRTRYNNDLEKAHVQAFNLRTLAFELSTLPFRNHHWNRIIARNNWFQRMVVRHLLSVKSLHGSPRTIMAYSYAAKEIFAFARSRGWRTVLGQIDPGPPEDRIVSRLHAKSAEHTASLRAPPLDYWANWRDECLLADRIVVNSEWSRQALLEEGVAAQKIKLIPLAYDWSSDARLFRRSYPSVFTRSRPLRVLFLGQVNLRKGIEPLLEATRLLTSEPVEFSFVGPVQISIPKDLRTHPQVRWFGSVPQDDTSKFYQSADIFVFPTHSDGFGLTQLEAQAWKLPIIATKYCGEVVRHGENGWILSELTPGAIAERLRFCISAPSVLQSLSARSRVPDCFDLDHTGKQWLQVFEFGKA